MVRYWNSKTCSIVSLQTSHEQFQCCRELDSQLQAHSRYDELVDVLRLGKLVSEGHQTLTEADFGYLAFRLQGTDGLRAFVDNRDCTGDESIKLFLEKRKLTKAFCRLYCAAFANMVLPLNHAIAFGSDGRDEYSNAGLKQAILQGLIESGLEVLDLGIVPSPMLAAYSFLHQIPGIMLTASHNPASHNGIKLFLSGRKLYPDGQFGENHLSYLVVYGYKSVNLPCGFVKAIDGSSVFNWLMDSLAEKPEGSSRFLVLDAANGAYSSLALNYLKELGFLVVDSSCSPMPGMINNDSSVAQLEELDRIQRFNTQSATVRRLIAVGRLVQQERTYGIVLDGDGDRAFVLIYHKNSDSVEILNGDDLGYLIARSFGKDGVFCCTVESDCFLDDQVSCGTGWKTRTSCVGDRWLSRDYANQLPYVGCEKSGHVLFPIKAHGIEGSFLSGNGLATAAIAISELDKGEKTFCHDSFCFRKSVWDIDKDCFFRGSELFRKCAAVISSHEGFQCDEQIFNEEQDMLCFDLKNAGAKAGRAYVRKSGTEEKLSVSLCVAGAFEDQGKNLFDSILEIIE